MKSVCVYCGSSYGSKSLYTEVAQTFGSELVRANLTLVYGGAKAGLMGAIADSVLAAGGTAIGVIPELLIDKEVGHRGLTELHVVSDMHERKKKMADLADAFVALPGGVGTFEEFFEVFTWAQLGYHQKPIGLLNADGFYDRLLDLLNYTAEQGFMQRRYISALQVDSDPSGLLARLRSFQPVTGDRWSEHRSEI